jgi:hypothetical protein
MQIEKNVIMDSICQWLKFIHLAATKPHLMLLVGYGGFIVIAWLMMFKSF